GNRERLEAPDADGFRLAELIERPHRGADGLAEAHRAEARVLAVDEQFGAKGAVVADKCPTPGAEAEGERFVRAVADPDREGDRPIIREGGREVERRKHPLVRPTEGVARAAHLEAGLVE